MQQGSKHLKKKYNFKLSDWKWILPLHCEACMHVQTLQMLFYWPAAFRSISARSLASSLVLATTCPSPAMSGTAFLRPVRSQLMKSEYDVSTSIICPWPALSLHLPEGRGQSVRQQINHTADREALGSCVLPHQCNQHETKVSVFRHWRSNWEWTMQTNWARGGGHFRNNTPSGAAWQHWDVW